MKNLLALFPRPSRYIGSEWGSCHKNKDDITVHYALAFPDLYEVGMSYLGHKVLSEVINGQANFWAERVYAPCEETAKILKEYNSPLCTLESDTPLKELDVIGFSLTHELCYTNILYMLELSHIPLLSKERTDDFPLIIAGGGVCFNAEPMADIFDIMIIGDGEELILELLAHVEKAKKEKISKKDLLYSLRTIQGIYIPSFFELDEHGNLLPLYDDYTFVEKAIVKDLKEIPFPTNPVQSFGSALHDRYTMEIARGCTRGCRFCQAGVIYRPVRERAPIKLEELLLQGTKETGFEEVSFLSLSTGDYSALEELFTRSFERCAEEQITISLPSLRVGSISSAIMERMAKIRRSGATIAPEAGSQRLRDVINKGITEDELIAHASLLFKHGWTQIKLYFMIGLPTETKKDIDEIIDLCKKVRDVAGAGSKQLQVTLAVSPFIPKPCTPFQWEAQISQEEIFERIYYIKDQCRMEKRLKVKYHAPTMTFLEGIFARGDRKLFPVLLKAYAKGALFSSWNDHLNLDLYLEAMEECGLDPKKYTGRRELDEPLAWDHIHAGVTKEFLAKELKKSLKEELTNDCRYNDCHACGVCDFKNIRPLLINKQRDQTDSPVEKLLQAGSIAETIRSDYHAHTTQKKQASSDTVSNDLSYDSSNNMPNEIPNNMPSETSYASSNNIAHDAPHNSAFYNDIARDNSDHVSHNNSGNIPNSSSNDLSNALSNDSATQSEQGNIEQTNLELSNIEQENDGGDNRSDKKRTPKTKKMHPEKSARREALGERKAYYRLWFTKKDSASWLSQLELQSIFERILRRAAIPISFSQGFHPTPRLSFGKALPVGVESVCEWITFCLREEIDIKTLLSLFKDNAIIGLEPYKLELLPFTKKTEQSQKEVFHIQFLNDYSDDTLNKDNALSANLNDISNTTLDTTLDNTLNDTLSAGLTDNWIQNWKDCLSQEEFIIERRSKLKMKKTDIRKIISHVEFLADKSITVTLDWHVEYMNPLTLILAVSPDVSAVQLKVVKTEQIF